MARVTNFSHLLSLPRSQRSTSLLECFLLRFPIQKASRCLVIHPNYSRELNHFQKGIKCKIIPVNWTSGNDMQKKFRILMTGGFFIISVTPVTAPAPTNDGHRISRYNYQQESEGSIPVITLVEVGVSSVSICDHISHVSYDRVEY